jgi:hypothetical protein
MLAAGTRIAERLKARCPTARGKVFSARDLADVEESRQITPALHVVLYSYRPLETRAGSARWEQVWLVVAVVKHAARTERALALIDEGAALVDEALAALSGWHPGPPAILPLTVIDGPRPGFSETHAYFPLAFAVTTYSRNRNKQPAPWPFPPEAE